MYGHSLDILALSKRTYILMTCSVRFNSTQYFVFKKSRPTHHSCLPRSSILNQPNKSLCNLNILLQNSITDVRTPTVLFQRFRYAFQKILRTKASLCNCLSNPPRPCGVCYFEAPRGYVIHLPRVTPSVNRSPIPLLPQNNLYIFSAYFESSELVENSSKTMG